jgi:hypothetical protein
MSPLKRARHSGLLSSAGNGHLDRLMSDPQTSADVTQAHAESGEMDRAYATNLAQSGQ